MAEWHIPFDHIEERWTDRQLALMAERLLERLKKQRQANRRGGSVSYVDHLKQRGVI